MNYFIYTSHHFTSHGRYELNKLTSLPMCGFIAQLVAPVSRRSRVRIPLKPWFSHASLSNCLNWRNLLRWSFFTFMLSSWCHSILSKQSVISGIFPHYDTQKWMRACDSVLLTRLLFFQLSISLHFYTLKAFFCFSMTFHN